jgi:hypothetical protein
VTLVRGDERLARPGPVGCGCGCTQVRIPDDNGDPVPRPAASKIQRWRLAPYHENGATPPWTLPSTR